MGFGGVGMSDRHPPDCHKIFPRRPPDDDTDDLTSARFPLAPTEWPSSSRAKNNAAFDRIADTLEQVEKQEKPKTPKGRAKKRLTYTRRFVNVTLTGGKRKVGFPRPLAGLGGMLMINR
jgi:small subunit ribosomal protein S30e